MLQSQLQALLQLYHENRADELGELESMTAVASVLLNLDEITSK